MKKPDVVQTLKEKSLKEFKKDLIKLGIITKDGKLTERYKQP
jgi:hypothetical protein